MTFFSAFLTVPLLFYFFSGISDTPQTLAKHTTVTVTPTRPPLQKTQPKKVKRIIKPTSTPTPTITPIPPLKPVVKKIVLSSSDSANQTVKEYIINAINEYRKLNGLTTVAPNEQTCSFAKTRAQEIATDFTHGGFRTRIDNKTLPYPGYKTVTENIAQTSDYKRVVTLWINSPGHAENMRKDTPFVCVEQSGNNYAYEGWKP